MFAVIKTGGRQFCVSPNDVLKINKINNNKDDVVEINDVLMYSDDSAKVTLGNPLVSGACVKMQVLDQIKDDKVIVFKKHRRHNYRRKRGHRQDMTVVRVLEISVKR